MVVIESFQIKRKGSILNDEERCILALGAIHLNGKQISNTEIGQRLGIPVNRVKMVLHQACAKLKARTRNEAILFALIRDDISLSEIYSIDEIAMRFSSLEPDIFRKIANIARQGMEYRHILWEDEEIVSPVKRPFSILTQAERDVLILAGYGLPNKEIADRLYISISAVRTFLYRACTKLGACRRADAVVLALMKREISATDIFSPDELINILARLGADTLEEIAQLLETKIRQEQEFSKFGI